MSSSGGVPILGSRGGSQDLRISAGVNLQFYQNNAEGMRLTSTGLGVGTTSPAYKIEAKSSTAAIGISGTGTTANNLAISNSNTSNAFYVAQDNSTGSNFNTGVAYGPVLWTTASSMAFVTNSGSNIMTYSSGNLLVGTTSGTGAQLRVHTSQTSVSYMQNSAASPNGLQIYYSNATAPNNVINEFLYCNDISALRMSVRSNGGIANYSGNNVNLSDRREKTNFAPATSYLDKICAIPVQTFNYIDQNMEEDGGLTLGVIAQDVQSVAPELVMESNWASKDEEPKMRLSIYQTDLQYALMKCIQEQQALITQLQADVATLKGN
jgi:hypothetical protein